MNCTTFFRSTYFAKKPFFSTTFLLLLALSTGHVTHLSGAAVAQATPQSTGQGFAQAAGQVMFQAAQQQLQENTQNFWDQHKSKIIKSGVVLVTTAVILASSPASGAAALGLGTLKGLFWGVGIALGGDEARKLAFPKRSPIPTTQPMPVPLAQVQAAPQAQPAQPTINVNVPNYPVTEFNDIKYKVVTINNSFQELKRTTKNRFAKQDKKFAKQDKKIAAVQQGLATVATNQERDHQNLLILASVVAEQQKRIGTPALPLTHSSATLEAENQSETENAIVARGRTGRLVSRRGMSYQRRIVPFGSQPNIVVLDE